MSLSLIIPNYNNEKYLEDCLNSVINQTYTPKEVIITDDASTDNSTKIIKEYEKKYNFIRGIYNKENRGVAYNRHQAILDSNCEYITTLDSDDFFFNRKKLEEEMKLINKFKNKYGKDIIAYSNIVRVNKEGEKIKTFFKKGKILEGDIFLSIITMSNNINPRDFIMKKEHYLNVGGYDSSIPIWEDWDLKIKLASKYEFYFTGVEGIAYRQHDEGLSSVNYRKSIKWLNRVFIKNRKLLSQKNIFFVFCKFYYFILKRIISNEIKNIRNMYLKNKLLNDK